MGLAAEEKVAEYFTNKKFKILKQRWRTPFAEIDLLVGSPTGEVWIVEIKTLSSFDFLNVRVSWKQRERLRRALMFVQGKTSRPVRLALACVAKSGVMIFEEF